MDYDVIVAGGGVVGSAIACGIARHKLKVAVLDEGDRAFRASRGNFGLIWVQSKGWDSAAYAELTSQTASIWPGFNEALYDETGVQTDYTQSGGFVFCYSEADWQKQTSRLNSIAQHTDGHFKYEMLDNAELKKRIPNISDTVLGASYSPQDSHVNPLYLLRALHQCMDSRGVEYLADHKILNIKPYEGGYCAETSRGVVSAQRIVLSAGLGIPHLAKMLDLDVPLTAQRGQILITERIKPFLEYPTLQIRQTAEGSMQLGDSHESVGLDAGTSLEIMQKIAARAVKTFPILSKARLIRAWGSLRVMSPDGKPIYHESSQHNGVYIVSCHSGVTLAAAHAGPVADWLASGDKPPQLAEFGLERFNV